MKRIFFVLVMFAIQSQAVDQYLVEPMRCKGQLASKNAQMSPDYYQIAMEFTSFYSVRRDGTKALSMEVKVDYFKENEKVNFNDLGASIWYMGPLYTSRGNVFRNSVGRTGDKLELAISESKADSYGRRDKLEGQWSDPNSVIGPVTYNLQCTARVVQKATKTLDYTSPKRNPGGR